MFSMFYMLIRSESSNYCMPTTSHSTFSVLLWNITLISQRFRSRTAPARRPVDRRRVTVRRDEAGWLSRVAASLRPTAWRWWRAVCPRGSVSVRYAPASGYDSETPPVGCAPVSVPVWHVARRSRGDVVATSTKFHATTRWRQNRKRRVQRLHRGRNRPHNHRW